MKYGLSAVSFSAGAPPSADVAAGSAGADVPSLVTTGASFFSGCGTRSSVSQLIVNSAILAGERPQQPPVAGAGLTIKVASPSAPTVALHNGLRMGVSGRGARPASP